jgi:hypothetical protein
VVLIARAECHGRDLADSPEMDSPSLTIIEAYGRDDFATPPDRGKAPGDCDVGLTSRGARFGAFTSAERDAPFDCLSLQHGERRMD